MPIGVQAVLPGPIAKDFLEVLTTFVLPRLRSFNGFPLPPASQPNGSPAAMSGVVSLGMKPEAMALFPMNEVNWDMYSGKSLGFQVSSLWGDAKGMRERGGREREEGRGREKRLGRDSKYDFYYEKPSFYSSKNTQTYSKALLHHKKDRRCWRDLLFSP